MLELAGSKNVYKQLDHMLLGQDDFNKNYPFMHRNKYDFVTAADLITNNIETEKIIEEMLLSLRNGGIMILTTKFSYLGNYWYTDYLAKLEKRGRI